MATITINVKNQTNYKENIQVYGYKSPMATVWSRALEAPKNV